ncbi:MAG: zinc ribbon domain-containing protein [Pseudomonadota bacterium]
MPIYEYQCTACGALHEALQKISDDPLVDCPACGNATLRKKISAVAFRLKGGGWYETDFKSGNKKNLAGDEGGSKGGDGDGKGDGKSDGKKADGAAKTAEGSASGSTSDNKAPSSKPASDSSAA